MLIPLEMLPRLGADWTGEVILVGRNPEIIDHADPGELPGYDGPVVVLRLQGDEVCYVKGTVMGMVKATQGPCQEPENTDAK